MKARTYAISAACIIILSAYLHTDTLKVGFVADDFAQIAMMRGLYPVPRAPLSLFTFSDGSAADNQALRDSGFFPWWSHPDLRISMWRPLSSALMWLDLSLFGLNSLAYHLHSFFLWLVMLVLLALLFHRLLPPIAALLALSLFVLDEPHALLLGWIAMRNAILATIFSLLALLLRHRALDNNGQGKRWPSLLAYALALLSGEYAIAFVGYLLLLEFVHSRGTKDRILAVIPWATLLVVYFIGRASLGFGSYASGTYINPFTETIAFAREAGARLPVLVGELVLGIRSNFWTSSVPWGVELAQLGIIPSLYANDMLPMRQLLERIGLFALVIFTLVVVVATRSDIGRRARFLFLGAPLALVPVLSPLPESRVLLPALVGFSAMFAMFLYASVTAWRSGKGRVRAALGLALGIPLLLTQTASGYYFGCFEVRYGFDLANRVRGSILDPKLDMPLDSAKRVLLFSAADATTSIYVPLVRKVYKRTAPDSVYLLTSTLAPHRLSRVGSNAFVLDRLHLAYTPGDAYSSTFNSQPLRVGQRFSVAGMQVKVERVFQGRPIRTLFILDRSLDDPRVLALVQTSNGLKRVAFPPVGRDMIVPPPSLPDNFVPLLR